MAICGKSMFKRVIAFAVGRKFIHGGLLNRQKDRKVTRCRLCGLFKWRAQRELNPQPSDP